MSMSTILSLSLAAIGLIAVVLIVILLLKNKGLASKIESALDNARSIVHGAEALLAPTPIGGVIHIVDEALQAAEVGVKFAEQLYTAGNAVDRKAVATKYVNDTLDELGLKRTTRLAGIIDGAVEAAVFLLPPTVHPAQEVAQAPQEAAAPTTEAPKAP